MERVEEEGERERDAPAVDALLLRRAGDADTLEYWQEVVAVDAVSDPVVPQPSESARKDESRRERDEGS